ncbi:MAG: Clp protease N-terminal domain-containing protein, partial [Phycisphaeraceae bacterium]|nr:Clp protease N-terminal domain-containing protein [Phycisphaeraceae bacterium]
MTANDRFTTKATEALSEAQLKAQALEHNQITALHLLAALMADENGVTRTLIQRIGSDPDRVGSMVDSELGRQPTVSGGASL